MTADSWTNDWLGTQPVFYNTATGRVSTSIHDVIDYRSLEFDPEGLGDFLDFGYCVFGRTPVRHVRFLPACRKLVRGESTLTETALPDPSDRLADFRRPEPEVAELIVRAVRDWEDRQTGEIVLPMSGGYDSRLLAAALRDRGRVRAFTYGLCRPAGLSHECVLARVTARCLELRWEETRLGSYHSLLQEWESLFGASTHTHGMYHLEFYGRIREQMPTGRALLSGIVGDLWAGSVTPKQIDGPDVLPLLGYSHGLDASRAPCTLRTESGARRAYWEACRERIDDPRLQVVELIRHKMMLLRYLLVVPRSLGFEPWSPFLSEDVALAMLALPPERRAGRVWQNDWLERLGLPARMPWWASRRNNLAETAFRQTPPPPLDASLLRELFPTDYIETINRELYRGGPTRWMEPLDLYGIGDKVRRRLGRPDRFLQAYGAYLTLKALEMLIARRNRA